MRVRNILVMIVVLLAAGSAVLPQSKKPATKTSGNSVSGKKIDGIHYRDIGDRKAKHALVFVHCWTCNAEFWKDNAAAFADKRVLVMDLPGHGMSEKPRTTYSMDYFANAVNTVMKDAGVEKAVLIGHSMGTPITRQFYRLYPQKTLAIVVVDGSLTKMFSRAEMEQFFAPLRANYLDSAAKFIDGMLEPVTDASLKKMIRDNMLATPDYVAISAMEAMWDEKIWTDDKLNVPVLAIMAPSPFWPKDLKDRYAAVAPNLEFQMWSGVSHFLQMEKPAEFNTQVRGFISRHKLL